MTDTPTGIILPEFNPFAIQFGDFGVRWYALAYIAGLLLGYYFLRREAGKPGAPMNLAQLDSFADADDWQRPRHVYVMATDAFEHNAREAGGERLARVQGTPAPPLTAAGAAPR